MRRDFKIDLILWMQDMVLRERGIDLINTSTDVTRVPVVYEDTHNYLRHYLMAAYDIVGLASDKPYTVRVYARFGAQRNFSAHAVTDLSLVVEGENIFSYNLWLVESLVSIYKLFRRFPIPGNCPVSPACFCSHHAIPKSLQTLDGTPLCPKVGHLPAITLIGESSLTYPYGTFFSDPGAVAYDAEDGDLSYALVTRIPDEIYSTGTHEVIYSVTDHDNNTVEAVRTVTVLPYNHGPSITLIPWNGETNPIHIPWSYPASDIVGATAMDYEDGDITSDVIVSGDIDTNISGVYSLTYTVTDSGGKYATTTRDVVVGENLVPEITLLPDANGTVSPISIAYNSDLSVIPGATASDPEDGDITANIVVTGLPNTVAAGSSTVTYSVTDSGGKTISVDREVVVLQNQPPIVTLLADADGNVSPISIPQWGDWSEPGATALDPEDGDVTSSVVITGTVDTSVAGTYTITYRAQDGFGIYGMAIRQVIVLSNISPTITLLPDNDGLVSPIPLPFLGTWVEPGATASDAEDGDISNQITISGDAVNNTVAGEYRVVYTVTDSGGLSSSATRIVLVAENEGPLISLIGNAVVTLLQGDEFIDPGALAGDPEDGDITDRIVVSGDTVDETVTGTYNIVYTVTDSYGLSDSVTRVVNIAPPEDTVTISIVGSSDFSESYDRYDDKIFAENPVDNRFVSLTWNNANSLDIELWMTSVSQTILQYINRLETSASNILNTLDTLIANNTITTLVDDTNVPVTLTRLFDYISTDPVTNIETVHYHVTVDATSYEEMNYEADIHITPSTGYNVVATSALDGDISTEVTMTADGNIVDAWYDYQLHGGDAVINYTYTVTHNGKTATTTVVQANHFSGAPSLSVYANAIPTKVPLRTRVWKVVPITSESTNYLKHIRIYDNSGTNIVSDGATGILGAVESGGRIYLNDETIVVNDANGVPMPRHAIADMSSPEVGYIMEGNTDLPIAGFTVVGIDNTDQSSYPQAAGFDLYVGDMAGHIASDSMLEDIANVNWTFVHRTSVDMDVYWGNDEERDYTLPIQFTLPEYTSWVDPGYNAQDTYGNDLTASVVINDPVDMRTPGTYTVNYSITDAGETVTDTRTVIVDNGKTGISLGSNNDYTQGDYLVHILGDVWTEPPVMAIDVEDGDLSADVVITPAPFEAYDVGIQTRIFTLTNARGYISKAIQIVDVRN